MTHPPPTEFRYKAFISYAHTDRKIANRLHRALENYRLPSAVVANHAQLKTNRLGAVFLDREELGAGPDLGATIQESLRAAEHLIVICSPAAVASHWVNAEVAFFQSLGRSGKILCLLLDEPGRSIPPAVLQGNTGVEPLAADLRDTGDGWRDAKLKLIATLSGVPFTALHRRESKRQVQRLTLSAGGAAMIAIAFAVLALFAFNARDTARAEASKATAVSMSLKDILTLANPINTGGEELTVRELLDDVAGDLGNRLGDQPDVEADIRHTIGATYAALGAFDRAEAQLRESLAAMERIHGRTSDEALLVLTELLALQRASGQTTAGLTTAQARADDVRNSTDPMLKAVHQQITGALLLDLGRVEEAEALLQQALGLLETIDVARSWPQRITTLTDLAAARRLLGDKDGTEQAHRTSLALMDTHPDIGNGRRRAAVMNNLGLLLRDQGKRTEAIAMLRESLLATQRLDGPDHPETAITTLNLGSLLMQAGHLQEAREKLQRALTVMRGVHDGDFYGIAIGLTHLANVDAALGDYPAALHSAEQAMMMLERLVGPGHWRTARAQLSVCRARRGLGELTLAQSACKQAVAILSQHVDGRNRWHVIGLLALAGIQREQQHLPMAGDSIAQAQDILDRLADSTLTEHADLAYERGRMAYATNPSAAATHFQAAITHRQRTTPGHYLVFEYRSWLGATTADPTLAQQLLLEGHRELAERLAPTHPLVIQAAERADLLASRNKGAY